MCETVRQSTAVDVLVGPVLDADGVAVTTLTASDFKVSKNGGAPAALNGSATATHQHTGHYVLALTTSDVDTVGRSTLTVDSTTNAMQPRVLQVVEEAIYDALFASGATGLLPANVTQLGGDAQSLTDLKDFADAGYDPSTNKVQGVVLVDTTTAVTNGVTVTTNNDKTGYSISGTKTTLDALNDISITQVNAEVDTALADIGLDHLIQTALPTDPATDIALNSVFGYIMDAGTAWSYDRSTDSLEALAGGGAATDWTATEKEHIRHRLGIDGTASAPTATPSLATQASVDAIGTNVDAILVDTNELQADWTDGGRLDLIIDAVLADTNELQTTWATGGTNYVRLTNIESRTGVPIMRTSNAQGGSASTIILDPGASASDDYYNHLLVKITGGTGADQVRSIHDYVGSTKTATVVPDWTTAPDATSAFSLLAAGEVHVYELHSGAIQAASFATDSITADALAADAVTEIQGDKTGYKLAADGLDLVVPADPSAIPVLGTSSVVAWIGYFGLWSTSEVNSDANSVDLRNSADTATVATHSTSDDGTTFVSGAAT